LLNIPLEDYGPTTAAPVCMDALPEESLEEAPIKRHPCPPPMYPRDEHGKPVLTSADGARISRGYFYVNRRRLAREAIPNPTYRADCNCKLLQLPYPILLQISVYLDYDKAVFALLGLPASRVTRKTTIIERKRVSSKPKPASNPKRESKFQHESKPKQENEPKRKGGPGRRRLYPRDEDGKPIHFNADGSRIAKKPKYNNVNRTLRAKGRCRKKRADLPGSDSDD
jgi:hypothetical protein